jgi:hypothetical protein
MMFSTVMLAPVPVPAQQEAENAQEPGIEPASGYFFYAGGPVRAKRARTQTAAWRLQETRGWVRLPGAVLQYNVPAGTSDLFNVAFSAECRLFGGGGDDYLRIRIAHVNPAGVVTYLEPYDGAQAFCDADSYATHKGNWVKRVGGGLHSLYVEFWIFDGAPLEVLSAWIDDWTFELVVYD